MTAVHAVAPAAGIKVSIARCEWHAEGPAHSTAGSPATIAEWKLAKASLLGGAGGGFCGAGTAIVLRNREPAALQLTVRLAEACPSGGVKTHTATCKAKINPVALTHVRNACRRHSATPMHANMVTSQQPVFTQTVPPLSGFHRGRSDQAALLAP